MDHNIASDIIAILEPFARNRADNLLHNIVLVDCPSIVGDDYWLPCIRSKGFFIKNVFREPQLPSYSAVRQSIFKDSGRGNNRRIIQKSLLVEVGTSGRDAVNSCYPFQFWWFSAFHGPFYLLLFSLPPSSALWLPFRWRCLLFCPDSLPYCSPSSPPGSSAGTAPDAISLVSSKVRF